MTPSSEHEPDPLGPLADAPVPALDPARRDRIEAALRVQAANRPSAPTPLRRWPAVVPLALIVAVLATVALLARANDTAAALELRAADNVEVTLPDGRTVTDPADGFVLTDGAVVAVGAGGSVVIDDVRLTEGAVVRVDDGRLVSEVVATTTTSPGPSDTRPAPPSSVRPPVPEPTGPPVTSTRPPDATTSTTAPPVTATRAPTTTGSVPRPEEPPTEEPPAEGDGPIEVALALRVRRLDRRVVVDWSATGVREGWSVLVLRTTDGSDPRSPATATVVGRGPQGDLVEAPADLGDRPAEVRYRVVVTDEAGGVVAASAVQGLPPEGERVP